MYYNGSLITVIIVMTLGWHEVEGSKVNIIKDSLRMLRDLLIIRMCYLAGHWKIEQNEKQLQIQLAKTDPN